MARRRGESIGAVLAALRPDFPDLTISKIRFLEAEGLVTPARTESGYRVFTAADIERLRYILTAQRDRFWPLKVIGEALEALDRGLTPEPHPGPAAAEGARPDSGPSGLPVVPAPEPDVDVPSPQTLRARRRLRLTEVELMTSSGLDRATFEALQTFGLLRADASGHFDDAALSVAHAAAALAGFGVEARHLRPFRTAAEREVGLVQQIVVPALAAQGKRGSRGTDPTAEVLHHCLALHAALVRAELAR